MGTEPDQRGLERLGQAAPTGEPPSTAALPEWGPPSADVVPESLRTKLAFPYAGAGWWLEPTAAVADRTMVTAVTAGQPVVPSRACVLRSSRSRAVASRVAPCSDRIFIAPFFIKQR